MQDFFKKLEIDVPYGPDIAILIIVPRILYPTEERLDHLCLSLLYPQDTEKGRNVGFP